MNHEEDEETGKCACGNEWPCVEWVMAVGGKMTPGQVAYEKWNAGEGYNPKPNSWARIGPQERKRWEHVAQAVINQYEQNACVRCGPNDPNPCADGKHWMH